MVSEALLAANSVYHFDEVIWDPKRYIKLIRDDLIQVIKRSKKPELRESAALLKRIDERDLYKCVGEMLVSREGKNRVQAVDIATFSEDGHLRSKDLIVHAFRLDWGLGEEYPLDHIAFFSTNKPDQLYKLKRGDMT